MNVVLSCPHCFCNDMEPHVRICDTNAKKALESIRKELLKYNIIPKIIQSHELRSIIDHNRPWDFTYFLTALQEALQGAHVLLDIHSFPPSDSHWSQYDVVLMPIREIQMPFAQSLQYRLTQKGINVLITQGSTLNRNTELANQRIPPLDMNLLIEFREDLSQRQLDILSQLIVSTLEIVTHRQKTK